MSERLLQIRNLKALRNKTKSQIDAIARNKLKQAASDILFTVVSLANMGRNANNEIMKPYSNMYKEIRKQKGLRMSPNLQFTSDMIKSIRIFEDELQNLKISIGVSGVGRDGVANSEKLRKVQKIKNYYILKWTPFLSRIISVFFKGAKR
jgi:hypothetical protein